MSGKGIIWKIVVLHLMLYMSVGLIHGCGLLKNRTKQKLSVEEERINSENREVLDLSQLYRESKVYTYREDGTLAQYEWKREQVQAATLKKEEIRQQEHKRATALEKKSIPARIWILAGMIGVVIIVVAARRFLFRASFKTIAKEA